MFDRVWRPGLAFAGVALALTLSAEAHAESVQKQCSEKYQAAKAANSLNGQNWNQFYKQCAAELKGAPPGAAATPATPAASPPPATTEAAPPPAATPARHRKAASESAPVPTGPIVFPNAISPQYANDKPGKAREKTCLDQYHANKATNSNGGLRWIEKGDGYYSECNKKLKGGA